MLNNEEILKFINEDKTSKKKRNAEIGQRYYEAEHDILNYRMFYFNSDGKLVEDNTRSNINSLRGFKRCDRLFNWRRSFKRVLQE